MNLFELKEEIDETEIDINYHEKELIRLKQKEKDLKSQRDSKYSKYKEVNNFDKQIYTEKKLLKWSDNKISAKHNGMSRTQIWNIVNKIEKLMNKSEH